MLNTTHKEYIEKSILCWLASSSSENIPNVSPKEIFTYYGNESIIIANIASQQSVKNIKENPNVCVSFIDILIQKGYQLKGTAEIIKPTDNTWNNFEKPLLEMTQGKYPFASIIKVIIHSSKQIIAPKYLLYPETTEEDQILSAKKIYGL